MEMGGVISHGAVVAREYGIPAVVGVPDATTGCTPDRPSPVDGAAGTIRVVSAEKSPSLPADFDPEIAGPKFVTVREPPLSPLAPGASAPYVGDSGRMSPQPLALGPPRESAAFQKDIGAWLQAQLNGSTPKRVLASLPRMTGRPSFRPLLGNRQQRLPLARREPEGRVRRHPGSEGPAG